MVGQGPKLKAEKQLEDQPNEDVYKHHSDLILI